MNEPCVIFVDLEASGPRPDSWPIEIGLVWIDDAYKIRSESRLIRPRHPIPSKLFWPEAGWNLQSAAAHKIPAP